MRGRTAGRTAADPFEIRTMVVAGEEIPFSDPYVTDAQRAAAGRETVAERARALLAANRERAARRYATGGLPDGEDTQRVWCAPDPADLRARLGHERFTAWAEGDVLHVLWQADDDHDRTVTLAGGLSGLMWPVDGADGLFEASLRVRRLDEAVLTLVVLATGEEHLPFGRPATDHLPLPGCVLADGQATRAFAEVLEAAIVSGAAPPVLLVGIHSGGDPGELRDRRAEEYLPRHKPRRFAAHLTFVTGEAIPWAAAEFGVAAGPWVSAGFSNGAAWAIGAAMRRPDVFGGVAALSVGMTPKRIPAGRARCQAIRRGGHARAELPQGDGRVRAATRAGRRPLRAQGMGRRPRQFLVAAHPARRARLAALLTARIQVAGFRQIVT